MEGLEMMERWLGRALDLMAEIYNAKAKQKEGRAELCLSELSGYIDGGLSILIGLNNMKQNKKKGK